MPEIVAFRFDRSGFYAAFLLQKAAVIVRRTGVFFSFAAVSGAHKPTLWHPFGVRIIPEDFRFRGFRRVRLHLRLPCASPLGTELQTPHNGGHGVTALPCRATARVAPTSSLRYAPFRLLFPYLLSPLAPRPSQRFNQIAKAPTMVMTIV